MRRRTLTAACAVTVLALTAPSGTGAQIRASEAAVVSQTIDGTVLTLEYSRPSARGRDLFGALVPWNVVWTPGANWATTLEASRDVRLEGVEVPAGTYSVWMIPREERWTLTLDRNAELFHFQKPDSTEEQIHVAVEPETGPHTEMLTWSFPTVVGDAAVLTMRWGATSVPMNVVVQPSTIAVPEGERDRYVGAYDLEIVDGLGWPTSARLDVFEDGGTLRARLPFPFHPGDELTFDLVPAGTDRFSPGLYRDGELFNVEPGGTFEFDVEGDRAVTVRIRGAEGSVFGEGARAGS